MFSNTYVQMVLLGIGIAALIYLLLMVIFTALNIPFPQFLQVTISLLGSGYLVYRFLMRRLG